MLNFVIWVSFLFFEIKLFRSYYLLLKWNHGILNNTTTTRYKRLNCDKIRNLYSFKFSLPEVPPILVCREFSNYANDFNAIFTIGRSDSKVNVICIIHVGIKEKKFVNFKDFRAKLIWVWLVIGKLHPNRRNEHIYQILFFLYVSAKLWLIESMSGIQDPCYSCLESWVEIEISTFKVRISCLTFWPETTLNTKSDES